MEKKFNTDGYNYDDLAKRATEWLECNDNIFISSPIKFMDEYYNLVKYKDTVCAIIYRNYFIDLGEWLSRSMKRAVFDIYMFLNATRDLHRVKISELLDEDDYRRLAVYKKNATLYS